MDKQTLMNLGVRCEFIDTHTHTNTPGSDGVLSPFQQLDYAMSSAYNMFKDDIYKVEEFKGISESDIKELFFRFVQIHWSITDHNTAMAYEKIRKARVKLPENFILHTGIELEVLDDNRNIYDVTIIGIDRSFITSKIGKHYITNVVDNKNRLEDTSAVIQYHAFKKLGINIPELMDNELRYSKTGIRANDLAHDIMNERLFKQGPKNESEKNAKKVLLERGYNPEKGRSTYYRKFITNPLSIFYVDQTFGRLKLKEIALNVMKDQPRATLLISHPGVYEEKKYGTMEEFVWSKYSILIDVAKILKVCYNMDISKRVGFECGHRNMSLEQTQWVKDFCQRQDLLYSAESDFHDPKHHKPFYINGGKTFITREYISDKWFKTPTFDEW